MKVQIKTRILQTLLFVCSAALASFAGAANLETRYGKVEIDPNVGEADRLILSLKGNRIGAFDGIDAILFRVTPNGPKEYLIIDVISPGLHCHHEYAILELSLEETPVLSKPFGKCTALLGAKYFNDGVMIELRKTGIEENKKQDVEKYKWSKGVLTRQP